MDELAKEARLIRLDHSCYPLFREEIIALYLHAYTTGDQAQYIEEHEAAEVLDATMRDGFGWVTCLGGRLMGAVLAMPLEQDTDFPDTGTVDFVGGKVLFVKDLMVCSGLRGQGVGSMLMEKLLTCSGDYSSVVIRVWEENQSAMKLYRKLGFSPIASITQTKRRSPDKTFEMRKIYMHRYI